jgi:hypothetical protein
MVGRIVDQFHRQLRRLGPVDQPIDEPAATAVVLRSVVQVEL